MTNEVAVTRAELHLHTKLSDDPSVIGVEDVFENAAQYGLSAVAFTNLNNVQNFPEIMEKATRFRDVNVIYGAQVYY